MPRKRGTFLERVASVFRVIKFELLIGLLALLLSLGQYFQSVISIRINITDIWREGYTAETRDRVSKFRFLYRRWVDEYKFTCQTGRCPDEHPDRTVERLIRARSLFDESLFLNDNSVLDPRIRELISDEIGLLKMEKDRYEVEAMLIERAKGQVRKGGRG